MYKHLTRDQRSQLSGLLRTDFSLREMARLLGVSPSTVSRELRRNRAPAHIAPHAGYHISDAHRQSKGRRAVANRNLLKIVPRSSPIKGQGVGQGLMNAD